MGRESVTVIKVVATVSRHNSDEDKEHDALVEDLHDRLAAIVKEPKYKAIGAWDVT